MHNRNFSKGGLAAMAFNIHQRGESARVFQYRSSTTKEVTDFYPERGLIRVEGQDKEGKPVYEVVSRRDFLLRAQALNLGISRTVHADERRDLHRLVACMIGAAKAAKDQGDPFNARAMADLVNERAKQSLLMPGLPAIGQAPAHKPILGANGLPLT